MLSKILRVVLVLLPSAALALNAKSAQPTKRQFLTGQADGLLCPAATKKMTGGTCKRIAAARAARKFLLAG